MLKWILGIIGGIIVLCVAAATYGYHKLTSGGDTVTVSMAATPARVFASLADYDSLDTWTTMASAIPGGHHGALKMGDTISTGTTRDSTGQRRTAWVVSNVVPNQLLVTELRSEQRGGVVLAVRRDSLTPHGDSTAVVSTIASAIFDSLRPRNSNPGAVGKAAGGFASKMIVSGLRIQAQVDLQRLRDHIAGREVPSATR